MAKQRITLSQSIEGYLLAARARRMSPETIQNYTQGFDHFRKFLERDVEIARITPTDVRRFLDSLTWLAPKSVRNYHTALASLWTWAMREGLVERHVVREVQAPNAPRREIVPYTVQDVKGMLAACERSRAYSRPGKRSCDNARPTALRDRAIILLLLDTGIRASELCDLEMDDCDLRNQRVTVVGKGRRERVLPLSARTTQAIWKYLASNEQLAHIYVFRTMDGGQLERNVLRRNLERLGEKAGVQNVTVHRFRHTFAITFLRNGGHVFALQRMLGHSTMEMVRRYLAIAETDVEKAHRDASPVANWLL